jgi:hypothetical protein
MQGRQQFGEFVQNVTVRQIFCDSKYDGAAQYSRHRPDAVKIPDGENQAGDAKQKHKTDHGTGKKLTIILGHTESSPLPLPFAHFLVFCVFWVFEIIIFPSGRGVNMADNFSRDTI